MGSYSSCYGFVGEVGNGPGTWMILPMGEPQARTRVIIASSRPPSSNTDNMDPLYIVDVRLPAVVIEFLHAPGDFLNGAISLRHKNSTSIHQPTPIGCLSMTPDTYGRTAKTSRGVVQQGEDTSVEVWAKKRLTTVSKESLHHIPTRYQVFSHEGSLPIRFTLSPFWIRARSNSDVNNNRARSLPLLECWLIAGGAESLFKHLPKGYVANAISTATTPAVKLYLMQLVLDLLGASPMEDTMVEPNYLENQKRPRGIAVSRHALNQARKLK